MADFNPESTRLLIELGMQYVDSGATTKIKSDLLAVANAARAATSQSGATILQAATQARQTAQTLYGAVVQSMQQASQSAIASIQASGRGFANTMGALWHSIMGQAAVQASRIRNPITGRFAGSIAASPATGIYAVAEALAPLRRYVTSAIIGGSMLVSNAASAAGQILGRGFTAVRAGLSNFAAGATTALSSVLGTIGRAGGAILRPVGSALAAAGGGIGGIGGAIGGAIGGFGGFISQSQTLETVFGGLASTFRSVTSAATRLAVYGLGALVAQFTALAYGATKIATEFIHVNEQFQGLEIVLNSSFKSRNIASNFKDTVAGITATSPLPFEGIAELSRALSAIPQTRGRLMDQGIAGTLDDPNGFLKKMVLLAEKMTTFRPDKNVTDVVFSLREALGGEFRSLVRRFDIPLSVITQLSGKSAKELKTDGLATIDSIAEVFDKLITTQAIRERERQPSVVGQNIKEQLGGVSFLRIGEAGFYNKFQTELYKLYENVHLLNQRSGKRDADGSPIKDSIVDKYAPAISESLSKLFDNLSAAAVRVAENVMTRLGFGKDIGPNVTLIERAVMAVDAGVKSLTTSLPATLEKIANLFSKIVPMLTAIGSKTLEVATNLAKMFGANPALATAGLLFGPTRNAMLASSAGLDTGAAIGIGALSSAGATRFAGQSIRSVAAGGAGVLSGIASTLTIAGGVTVAGALIVGSIVDWMHDKTNLDREASTTAMNKAATALDKLAVSNPLLFEKNGPTTMAGRVTTFQDMLATVPSGTEILENDRKTDPKDFRQHLADILKLNAELGGIIDEQEIAKNFFDLTNAGKDFFNTLTSRIDYLRRKIDNGTAILAPKEVQDTSAFDKAIRDLTARFSVSSDKGGPVKSMEEAFSNSKLFGSSLGKAVTSTQQIIGKTDSPEASSIRDELSKFHNEMNPMAKYAAQVSALLKSSSEISQLTAPLETLLGKGGRSGMMEGQEAALANVKKTSVMIDAAMVEAKRLGKIPEQIYFGIGMNLKEAKERFDAILLSNDSKGGKAFGTDLEEKLLGLRDAVENTKLTEKLLAMSAVFNGMKEIAEQIDKGLTQGEKANNSFAALQSAINLLPASIQATAQGYLDAMKSAVPSSTEVSKQSRKHGAAAAYKVASGFAKNWATLTDNLAESALELQKQILGPFLATRLAATPLAVGQALGGVSQFSGGVGPLPALPEQLPNLDQAQIDEVLGAGGASLFGNSAISGGEDKLRDAAKTFSAGGQEFADRANRNIGGETIDLHPTINALEDIVRVISASRDLHDDGPMLQALQKNMQDALKDLPGLSDAIGGSLTDVFKFVREGNKGIDDLYDKAKSTAIIYEKLEAFAKKAANQPGLSAAQKDSLLDKARGFRDKATQESQFTFNLDKKNHPVSSFLDGLVGKLEVAKKTMYDFTKEGQAAADSIQKNLGNAFYDFVSGAKSGKEAMRDFAIGVVADLAKIAAEAAAKQLLGLLISVVGSAAGGSSGGGGWGQIIGALVGGGTSAATGYAEGGHVTGGSGVRDDIPAMLMGGEYVLNRKAVDALGVHNLDALNEGRVRHYAAGGYVGPSVNLPAMGNTSHTNHINISVNAGDSSGGNSETADKDQSTLLATKLRDAVKAVIREEQRPNGILRNNSSKKR